MKKRIKIVIIALLMISLIIIGLNFLDGKQLAYKDIITHMPFTSSNEITLDTPDGLMWKEESTATATWNTVANANYYIVNVYVYDENDNLIGSQETGTSDVELDVQQEINNILVGTKYTKIKVKFDVKAQYTKDDILVESDKSIYSSEKEFLQAGKIQLKTATDLILSDGCVATWNNYDSNTLYYEVDYKIIYNGTTKTGYALGYYPSELAVNNGTASINIEAALKNGYSKEGFAGETVEISYRLHAIAAVTSDYKNSELSEYSNSIYYNPKGSTVINNITLAPNKPVVAVGKSLYIGKIISPTDAYYSIINWSSNDNSIATIDSMGKITGIKKGNTYINAQINNASQSALVSVYEINSNIENVNTAKEVIDETTDIIDSIIVDGDSSRTDVKDVDKVVNEIESGAQAGNPFKVDINYDEKSSSDYSNIKDKIEDKYEGMNIAGGYNIEVEVYHSDNENQKHHIANITELNTNIDFKLDMPEEIPELSKNQTREYLLVRYHDGKLENIDVDINADGTFSSSSNKFSDFIVLYKDTNIPTEGIILDKTYVTLNKGDETSIEVTIKPDNAANKNYTSISSNTDVVTVEENKLTAVGVGNAVVTFKTVDGEYAKTVNVTVKNPLKEISFEKTSGTLNVDDTKTLTVIYNPDDTTDDKKITWLSSNTNVATVEDGKITALEPGETTITARVGTKTATYELKVYAPLKNISFNESSGTFGRKESKQLKIIYNPINTTDDINSVIWTSSNEEVATVDQNGVVKTIMPGTATITAKIGKYSATYEITVKNYILRDINEDEKINARDAKLALQSYIGKMQLTEDQKLCADVNKDGKVNARDAKLILQYYIGKIEEF